jgi:S-ribosylhomocysteine lyase
MADNIQKITSFCVDHTTLGEGMYISRVDGDVTTFDLRTRRPNMGDYMDNATMHSLEHLFATYIRNSAIGDHVIYFGPMGCQTGFYLLTRSLTPERVKEEVIATLERILSHTGEIFGKSAKECGNYQNLDLKLGQTEAKRYLDVLKTNGQTDFSYNGGQRQ